MDTDMGCGPPATSTTLITTIHTPTTTKPEKNLQGVYLHTIYAGGGDRVVPVRGGVHALPHLLHPPNLPPEGREREAAA